MPQVRGAWGDDVRVVIAGLANTYSSYVTTFEEYGAQRYEGASTIFGPHTLDAYIQVRVVVPQEPLLTYTAVVAGRASSVLHIYHSMVLQIIMSDSCA